MLVLEVFPNHCPPFPLYKKQPLLPKTFHAPFSPLLFEVLLKRSASLKKMSLKWVAGLSLAIFLLILPSTPTVTKATTKTVGGSQGWIFGFNYTDWALKNCPFYINDTLIFRYDPPSNTTVPHNVYLLTRAQFKNCSFVGAKLVANENQGGGSGFKFILRKRKKPYYFACGVHEGSHCSAGLMKFSVLPFAHPSMD